jgi:hypothetical protein
MPPTHRAVKRTGRAYSTEIIEGTNSMGAGSSTGLGISPDMANKILTQIFTQTDMMKYLTMTDPKVCGDFVFPEISHKLQASLQTAGAKFKAPGQNAEMTAVCFDQAKGYSKAFEIYAALYPLLADSSVKRVGVSLLGGRRKTRRMQRGGAVNPTSTIGMALAKRNTLLVPISLFENVNINDRSTGDSSYTMSILLTSVDQNIQCIVPKENSGSSLELEGQVFNRRAQIGKCTLSFSYERDPTDQEVHISFSVNGIKVILFEYYLGKWRYTVVSDSPTPDTYDMKYGRSGTEGMKSIVLKKIKEIVGLADVSTASSRSTSYGSTSVGPTSTSAVTGSFFPQGPANIKVALKDFKEKKKNVPIALAVARALILLKHIDPANTQGPPTTQICSSKYTFEGKDAAVPRKGLALDKSYYFKSWINLYSDIGQLQGGKYEWTQSSAGKAELNEAAKDLSVLYSNPQQPVTPDEKFLSKPLPEFIIACPNKFSGEYLISPQVLPAIQAVVNNLLKVQANYMQKANAILAKIFTFKADGTVDFRPEILGRQGYQNLSAACVETRNTLFQYYMKVESLFIEGVMLFERARAQNLLQPV